MWNGGERALLEQCLDRLQSFGLVALDREQVVGALVFDEEVGVVALGVQRVRGHDRAFQVHILQQRAQAR